MANVIVPICSRPIYTTEEVMKKKKKQPNFPTVMKDRWIPTNNTRPQVFKDRKKEANRKACRNVRDD